MKKINILIAIMVTAIIITATLPFAFSSKAKKTKKMIEKEKQIFQTEIRLD